MTGPGNPRTFLPQIIQFCFCQHQIQFAPNLLVTAETALRIIQTGPCIPDTAADRPALSHRVTPPNLHMIIYNLNELGKLTCKKTPNFNLFYSFSVIISAFQPDKTSFLFILLTTGKHKLRSILLLFKIPHKPGQHPPYSAHSLFFKTIDMARCYLNIRSQN